MAEWFPGEDNRNHREELLEKWRQVMPDGWIDSLIGISFYLQDPN